MATRVATRPCPAHCVLLVLCEAQMLPALSRGLMTHGTQSATSGMALASKHSEGDRLCQAGIKQREIISLAHENLLDLRH